MCCAITTLFLLGPRFFGALWWIVSPGVWAIAFGGSWFWPLLGLVFLPWVTLMYVLVAPGGIEGLDWLWLGLALVADIGSYAGGGYGNRNRIPGYGTPATS
jgi:hypothetical protein